MSRVVLLLLLCLAGGSASAQSEGEAPAEAKPLVREAVEAGNYFFRKAFEARDAQAIADLYTEDGRVVPAGAEPVAGRAAIAAFWKAAMEDTKAVRLDTLAVEADGNLAYEEGVVHLTAHDGSESTARYLVVWKRVGRRWHLHRDIWNAGPAAPAGPAPTQEAPPPAVEPAPPPEPA
jgi:uncharacterized protein (TIGR02246 family)